VAARKPFLVRLDPAVLTAVEGWAADDLRSVNAQIEFLLREALRKAGRQPKPAPAVDAETTDAASVPGARRGVRSGS